MNLSVHVQNDVFYMQYQCNMTFFRVYHRHQSKNSKTDSKVNCCLQVEFMLTISFVLCL